MTDLLLKLQNSLIEACSRGREVVDVGGFRAMINVEDPLEYFSYAMPIGPIGDADVEAIKAHFKSRDRRPRLEFCRELWPDVPPKLEAAGFELEIAAPMMILPVTGWRPMEPMTPARLATPDEAQILRKIANSAFGMPGGDDDNVESSRQQIETGELLAAICEIDGQAIGCGFAQGNQSVREIAGIGTLDGYRRRGVASSIITVLLTKFFLDGGQLAWLTPGDDGAEAVYTKLGFEPTATQVNYRLSGE